MAISVQHPPVLGGSRDSAPTHPLSEVTNKIEVKLTAKLEKGSGSAALGKQGGKSKWRAFWKSQCHFPGSFHSLFKINFYWSKLLYNVLVSTVQQNESAIRTHPMKIVLLCPTLFDPMDCILPGSSVYGIS